MAVLTEPPRLTGVLKQEYDQTYCRETVTVLAGDGSERALQIGTVLGRISKGALSAAAAKRSGTGNGAITAVAAPAGTLVGVHSAVCIAAAADGGSFALHGPAGRVEGVITVGTPFSADGAPSLTITDGATDWGVGAVIDITVTQAAGSGKVVGLDLAAADGSADPYGVLLTNTTAPDGVDAAGVALVRGPAVLSKAALIYPAGATTNQKAAIDTALGALGLVVRQGV